METTSAASAPRHGTHPWFQSAVWALDARLRRRSRVIEFSDSANCVFRIQIVPNPADLPLPDGTRLHAADRTIILHMWNEQFPQMPAGGPTLGWARRVIHLIDLSLRELPRYLAARPQYGDVKVIRADMHPATPQEHRQFAHIMARYGFETVRLPDPQTPAAWLRRLGENILISILILARNPIAFRIDSLRRSRDAACISRRLLEHRYGSANRGPP